jgi:DNA-binding MarR family transcriptional regulator
MMSNEIPPDRQRLIEHILKLSEDIFRLVTPIVPSEWLSSDVTVAQLRVLLLLYTEGPSRMSAVAAGLGIALSTATGIMDNLVNKSLVERGALPDDRRVVLCRLTARGQELVSHVWDLGRTQVDRLLRGLTPRQLQQAAAVAESLLASAQQSASGGRPPLPANTQGG